VHDLDLLREHHQPLAQRRKRETERPVLLIHPARAHPELDAPAGDVVDRPDRVREQ
jgi:hypothetical protein